MTDVVEEAPLAQFKSALILSLKEEDGLEMYSDLVKEVALETERDPSEIAAALARLARRSQEPDVLERIAGYEIEKAKPGARASRVGASYDTNTTAAPSRPKFTEGHGRSGMDATPAAAGGRPYKPVEEGMARLFISAGRMDGIRPGDLVGAIAGETGIEGSAIGSIDIFSRYSFVEVPDRHGDRIVESMSGAQVRGREVTARIATSADSQNAAAEGDQRGGGGGYRGGGGGGYRGGGGGGYRGGGGGGYRGGGGGYRGGGGGYRGGGGGYRGGGGGGYRGGGGGGYRGGGGGGYDSDSGGGGGYRGGGGGYRRGGGSRRGGGGGGGYGGGWADTSGGNKGGGYDDSY